MEPSYAIVITDKNGEEGLVGAPILPEDTTSTVLVRLKNTEIMAEVPAGLLIPREDGGYYLPASLADFQSRPDEETGHPEAPQVIPLAKEELHVAKRTVEKGRVRVTKAVHEREEEVDLSSVREEIEIERIPLNRVVDAPPSVRYEDDAMIVPLLEEMLVVQKQLILKEEVRIRKNRVRTTRPQRVTLRNEEVVVERVGPQTQLQKKGPRRPAAAKEQGDHQEE